MINKKSNAKLRALRMVLLEKNMTMVDLAAELGVGRTAIYRAIYFDATRGKVAEWIRKNIKIDLKETA